MAKQKRRGNGEGTIYQRKDGKWQGQIMLGRNPVTGKPIRKSVYGETRGEVQNKLRQLQNEAAEGIVLQKSDITFGQWVERWLNDYSRLRVRATTYENYKHVVNCYMTEGIKSISLAKLKGPDLQRLYMHLLDKGGKSGTGVKPAIIKTLHTIVKQSLQQALRDSLIPRNSADSVTLPKEERRTIPTLTEKEVGQILNAVKGDRMENAVILMLATGMRRGELLGLKWDVIDLDAKRITIKRQMVMHQGRRLLKEDTKTNTSRRTISITDEVVKIIKKQRAVQAEDKLKCGGAWEDNGHVFTKTDGTPVSPENLYQQYKKCLRKAGLKYTLHDLRHAHASLLMQKGVNPKVVQERLGHASITMTMNIYSHTSPDMHMDAAEKLDSIFAER